MQQAQALVLCKQTLSRLMSENQPPDLHLKPSQQLSSSGPAALEQERGGYSTKQPPTRSLPSLPTTRAKRTHDGRDAFEGCSPPLQHILMVQHDVTEERHTTQRGVPSWCKPVPAASHT